MNLSWLAKLYTFDIKRVEKLVESSFEAGYHEEVSTIFHKYGWTSYTERILNSLIRSNKRDRLNLIISSSKNNSELASFAFDQLKSGNLEIFQVVMHELS